MIKTDVPSTGNIQVLVRLELRVHGGNTSTPIITYVQLQGSSGSISASGCGGFTMGTAAYPLKIFFVDDKLQIYYPRNRSYDRLYASVYYNTASIRNRVTEVEEYTYSDTTDEPNVKITVTPKLFCLLDTSQTISGTKTFTGSPILANNV